MKAAAIQMESGADVAANLSAAERLLRDAAAAGATLAVLPENFAFLAKDEAAKLAMAEAPGAGPVQAFLSRTSRELGLWLVGGTTPLRGDEPGRSYAASLLYAPDGACAARYDKIHLFDVGVPGADEQYRESATTISGSNAVSFAAPFGRLGMVVCYDIRFPGEFDALGSIGMDILAVPAAFTVPTGEAHWELLLRARAVESLCFVVAAAQWGTHPGGRKTYGHSMIVGPWGEVLARLPSNPGIVVAEVDIMQLESLRQRFPVLAHRRPLDRSSHRARDAAQP